MNIPASETAAPHRRLLCAALLLVSLFARGEAHAGLPEPLRDGVIVFGGDAAYPPFEWLDEGVARGSNIDMQDALAKAGGVHAEHRLGDWPDVVRDLETGGVDVVAMFKSPQRAERYRFSRTFEYVNHAIYGRSASANVDSIAELAGYSVAVESRSYAHDHLLADDTDIRTVLAPNTVAALELVRDGKADYAILSEPAADYLVKSHRLELRRIGSPLWPAEYAFAVPKDRQALAQWLDRQLGAIIESGRFQAIRTEWESRLARERSEPASRWLPLLAWPLAIMLLPGACWAFVLRRRLSRQASSLHHEAELRKIAESQFSWAASHDTDTELPKQHHFTLAAARLLEQDDNPARKQVVALKLADLDRIVRLQGHDAARDAMRKFAEHLRAAGFPAYGQIDRDVIAVFGDKSQIDRELRARHGITDTVSMRTPLPRILAGAATWPAHGQTVPELLRKAESALARAVERREDWVDFRPFMEPDRRAMELVSQFRETGGGAISPVFQPQIDLASGRIIGAEALARWHVPGKGPVSPGVFIPLLEDAGLIRHVTRRMIEESVRVAAALRREGRACPISVNVTGNDLLGWKLSTSIFRALRKYGGQAVDLKLELTETSVVERPEILQWKMRRLTQEGIHLSIDDFGTGYSSLAYLSDFPVREIKIDQSFVQDMVRSKKDLSIVASTIAMGHELGMRVVAEGVETEDVLDALRQHHCDVVQGYIFSKPLVEAEFMAFMRMKTKSTPQRGLRNKIAVLRPRHHAD